MSKSSDDVKCTAVNPSKAADGSFVENAALNIRAQTHEDGSFSISTISKQGGTGVFILAKDANVIDARSGSAGTVDISLANQIRDAVGNAFACGNFEPAAQLMNSTPKPSATKGRQGR